MNEVATAGRSYLGGLSEATARAALPCDLPLRNTIRNQPPDQRPILN